MKNKFLIFQDKDNNNYLLLSNFEFNKKVKPDYTHDIKDINEVVKFNKKGKNQFKMRFDFHTGHIVRFNEFYNYLDNIDKDFKNSNAKIIDNIMNSDLKSVDKVNIIYTGNKTEDNEIIKTNLYFIIPVDIDTIELNEYISKIDTSLMNKRLNDVFKSETVNQKVLNLKPSVTEINILSKQSKIIDEYFKDIDQEYNFINEFSKSE
ncbi:hypothetical protein [Staphylococcus phage vB_StaM_PB50]|nr:hypothetical protein [Staphylococcus phage vB_StaM_PB50]